jgi:hypothetical protein
MPELSVIAGTEFNLEINHHLDLDGEVAGRIHTLIFYIRIEHL